jgi:hypothetical protein
MPPRRSARVADAAERATSALSPLPLSVVLHIFSLLPVDCRLRCSEVCRGWRVVLLERSLWTRLDLSAASGVTPTPVDGETWDALFRCAAARAGGGLQSLHISQHLVSLEALLEVTAANAGALQELRVSVDHMRTVGFEIDETEALCVAAPLLRTFSTELQPDFDDVPAVRRALRNEAPFGPLRLQSLFASFRFRVDEAGVIAFAADVAAHASLQRLTLYELPLHTAAALDAVVDAALARHMHTVSFYDCSLPPASAPALARLLGGDALTTLIIQEEELLDAPASRVLAAALRANGTLTSLTLKRVGVFDDLAAAAVLLGALTGHASLQTLGLQCNLVAAADRAAVGAALGALVAANAPSLTQLDVSDCALGDDGMRALFEALPTNTHLRTLCCHSNNATEACVRDVLLPLVRANTSLRSTTPLGFPNVVADMIDLELRSRAPPQ